MYIRIYIMAITYNMIFNKSINYKTTQNFYFLYVRVTTDNILFSHSLTTNYLQLYIYVYLLKIMERHELNRYKVCDRIVVGVCSMSENLAVAYCSSSEQQHHSSSSSRL